ncbi:hypothetical protein E1178_16225 [Roseibium hamelinense]|nr:hypothetical protein [Roseibium hamelinense]MTI45154.1 hypothetical protein [Roseibium hamelinense]
MASLKGVNPNGMQYSSNKNSDSAPESSAFSPNENKPQKGKLGAQSKLFAFKKDAETYGKLIGTDPDKTLPNDVQSKSASYLNMKDTISLSQTSKQGYNITSNQYVKFGSVEPNEAAKIFASDKYSSLDQGLQKNVVDQAAKHKTDGSGLFRSILKSPHCDTKTLENLANNSSVPDEVKRELTFHKNATPDTVRNVMNSPGLTETFGGAFEDDDGTIVLGGGFTNSFGLDSVQIPSSSVKDFIARDPSVPEEAKAAFAQNPHIEAKHLYTLFEDVVDNDDLGYIAEIAMENLQNRGLD